jgi:MATE family multidrug resistance protein
MIPNAPALRSEVGPMLRLAVPVVLAEIGWVLLGVVDVMMVGRIDAESIGGVSVGRGAFFLVAVFGMGLLLGLDTLVAQAYGAGDLLDCRLSLLHGVYLALLLSGPMLLFMQGIAGNLDALGIDPRVSALAASYLRVVSLSLPPLLLYTALRRYLQAIGRPRPVMIALLSANVVHVAANWLLIRGHLGLPALGVVGAAWSTVLSSCYMTGFLAWATWLNERGTGRPPAALTLRPDPARLGRLVALGLPAGVQLVLEYGVIALTTMLAGGLAPASLAAHQIALNASSVTYMVTLGISAAAAVRVGHALGRGDGPAAATSGWTALALGTAFMSAAALVFVCTPRTILAAFTADPAVRATGAGLLYIAAVFQLFDGLQAVAIGALRGAGDTRSPMIWNLVGYWVCGLPVGYYLCFSAGLGALGLWMGLSLGLILVGSVLLATWARTSGRFALASR